MPQLSLHSNSLAAWIWFLLCEGPDAEEEEDPHTEREPASQCKHSWLALCTFMSCISFFNSQAPHSKNSPDRDDYRDKRIDINQQPSCASTQGKMMCSQVNQPKQRTKKESRVYLRSGEAEVWCDIQVPSVRQTSCRSAATCWRPRVEKRSRTRIDHVWGVNWGSRQHWSHFRWGGKTAAPLLSFGIFRSRFLP